ncbi:anti-sigma factor antagonist [Fundidesulfovibrio butyratiphilus]
MENLIWQPFDGALLCRCKGEITVEMTQGLKREVESALEKSGHRALVLDLSEVNFMDSSGIGFLVACNTRMQSMGKTLVLLRPSPQVEKTLNLVQLMSYFTVAKTPEEAASLTGQ